MSFSKLKVMMDGWMDRSKYFTCGAKEKCWSHGMGEVASRASER